MNEYKRVQIQCRKAGLDDKNFWENTVVDFQSCQRNKIIEYGDSVFGLNDFEGFYFVSSAVCKDEQVELAGNALNCWCEPPNATNLVNIKASLNIQSKLDHLSWATLGYHYNWTERSYCDDQFSPIPEKLQVLAVEMLQRIHRQTGKNVAPHGFQAQACIVNYYHTKSVMGGHKDDLELDLISPVVSISIGLSALFLLGGHTKDDLPVVPILVRAGDVMILSGASRLRIHGMALVLAHDKISNCAHSDPFVQNYLSNHRININLRQVLPPGVGSIKEYHLRQEKNLKVEINPVQLR